MPNPVSFRYFKTSPETIQLAVMLYVRFPLSLRNVEDLLHQRGGDVSYESVWHKWLAGQVNHLRIWIAWQFCLMCRLRNAPRPKYFSVALLADAPVRSLGLVSRRVWLLAPRGKLIRDHFVAEFGVIKGLIERQETRVLWGNSASSR